MYVQSPDEVWDELDKGEINKRRGGDEEFLI
jgi:hypothetical protein